jgi:hypothetical protein
MCSIQRLMEPKKKNLPPMRMYFSEAFRSELLFTIIIMGVDGPEDRLSNIRGTG